MSSPSVLHLLAPATYGGLEGVVYALASMRHQLGRRTGVVFVLDRWDAEHRFVTSLERLGIPLFPVVVPSNDYVGERRLLREVIRDFQPGILHTHGHRSDVMGAVLRLSETVRLVSTIHGFATSSARGYLYHWLQRLSYHAFDAIVAVSAFQRRQLLRTLIRRRKVWVIPNARVQSSDPLPREEARDQLGLGREKLVIGWVGRLSREKGADILLRAIAKLPDTSVTVSFLGDGRERASLERLASDLEVAGRVRWHGFQPDASRLFRAFDVFVLSSRTEGVPLVLSEALGAGVPIVAARVGGVPDVISTDSAVLVGPDDPDALAEGIRTVITDRAAAEQRARVGARMQVMESAGSWTERYEQVYLDIARV